MGWYGYNNLGDELLFDIITSDLLNKCNKIYYPCNPLNFCCKENNILKPLRLRGRLQFLKLLLVLLKCDLVVLGGGTYLRDIICSKILRGKLIFLFIAQILHKKTIIWGGGIGPFSFHKRSKLLYFVLKKFDHVLLRDSNSVLTYKRITGKLCKLVPDPVYKIYDSFDLNNRGRKNQNKKISIGLSLREWGTELGIPNETLYDEFISSFQLFLKELKKRYEIEIICFVLQKTSNDILCSDESVYNDLFNSSEFYDYKYIYYENEITKFTNYLGEINCLIGMRLHSLILASCLHIPMLAISYDIKIRSFMNDLYLERSCLEFNEINPEELMKKFNDIFEQDYKDLLRKNIKDIFIYDRIMNEI